MTALLVNFDRDMEQVGWMKGRRFMSMSGPNQARTRVEKGWEPVYRLRTERDS